MLITPRAAADLRELVAALGLPADATGSVQRSLRILERFPRAGRALTGRWEGMRFLVGPWPWMLLVHLHDEATDTVSVVGVHDARGSSAATGSG